MEKNILAICDLEEKYAMKLTDYLSMKKNVPFDIHVFTEISALTDFISNKEIDILLISEEAMYEFDKKKEDYSIGEIFVLSENGELLDEKGHRSIYKYQATENILREVMCYYAESGTLIKSKMKRNSGIEFIAVYSPIKRSLKTSFAMTMGQLLSEKKRVLYINLEEYAGFNTLMKTTYMSDMSDLMYYISQEKPNFIWKLASIVQSVGGLDYIPPALSPLDIKNISGEQWIHFFGELSKCNYEVVILDLGDCVRGLFDILRMCSRVYTPVRDDGVSYAKMEQYEALLRIMDYEDILDKTRKLSFSEFNGLDRGLDRLVYSELGQYVRNLIQREQAV